VTLIWGAWSPGGGRTGGDAVDSDSRPLDVRSSRRKGGGRSELKFAVYNRTDMRCGELEGVGRCIRSPCDLSPQIFQALTGRKRFYSLSLHLFASPVLQLNWGHLWLA
jgi:hypothetical protein